MIRNSKKSQGLVEYALILALVAVVVIAVLLILGPVIGNVFTTINSSLQLGGGVGGGGTHPTLTPTTSLIYDPLTIGYNCPMDGIVGAKNTSSGSDYGTHPCQAGLFAQDSFTNSSQVAGNNVVMYDSLHTTIAIGVFPAGHP